MVWIISENLKKCISLLREFVGKSKRAPQLNEENEMSEVKPCFFVGIFHQFRTPLAFTVEQLCKGLGIGRTSLYRKLVAITGENPSRLIRSYRLEWAAQLLRANAGNITEVAFGVGFTSTAYFTKCFKEKFHQLPSDLLISKQRPFISFH